MAGSSQTLNLGAVDGPGSAERRGISDYDDYDRASSRSSRVAQASRDPGPDRQTTTNRENRSRIAARYSFPLSPMTSGRARVGKQQRRVSLYLNERSGCVCRRASSYLSRDRITIALRNNSARPCLLARRRNNHRESSRTPVRSDLDNREIFLDLIAALPVADGGVIGQRSGILRRLTPDLSVV